MKKVLRLLAALLVAVLLFSGCSLSSPVQESKNGEVAKRPNTIENFRLKVFLQEQNDEAKENLFALYHAIMQFEETCYLPYPLPQEQVQSQLSLLCYECPELFQVDLTLPTSYLSYEGETEVIAVTFPYCMDKPTYDGLLAEAKSALSQFDTTGMTLLEAEKYIYDTLASQITYNASSTHSDNVYGALVEGQAKCDGIAKAMKWAMEAAGFPCMCVAGQPYGGGIGHAWNIIPVDGHYYHLDLTADVQYDTYREPMYPAYNVGSSFVLATYEPDPFFNIPTEQNMDASYHARNGNFFHKDADWESAIKKLFKDAYKNESSFPVQFASEADYTACLDNLEDLFREAARSANITKWSWSTVCVDQYYLINITVKQ